MKMTNLCAAALCVLAVAACADRMNKSSNTAGNDSGYGSSSSSGTGGTSGSSTGSGMAAQSTPATAPATAGATSSTTAQPSYGVVQAIDQLQRQDVGVGVMGAAAAGGMPGDKVYRVTVRLDDGSTQMVVLESSPSYKIGDRIRYSNGAVQAY
jgi:outer membrane lipoprotein SlyB